MLIAWLITIAVFITGYYTTVTIFTNIRVIDENELVQLESQLNKASKRQELKQAV